MDFRWVVFITLWTMFAGPVFAPMGGKASSRPQILATAHKGGSVPGPQSR